MRRDRVSRRRKNKWTEWRSIAKALVTTTILNLYYIFVGCLYLHHRGYIVSRTMLFSNNCVILTNYRGIAVLPHQLAITSYLSYGTHATLQHYKGSFSKNARCFENYCNSWCLPKFKFLYLT